MVMCSVIGCNHNSRKDKGVSFFRFPALITNQCAKTRALSEARRAAWVSKVNREDFTVKALKDYYRICSSHFIQGRPCTLYEDKHPDWVPSLKLGYSENASNQGLALKRYKCRTEKRPKVGSFSINEANQTFLTSGISMHHTPECEPSNQDIINVLKRYRKIAKRPQESSSTDEASGIMCSNIQECVTSNQDDNEHILSNQGDNDSQSQTSIFPKIDKEPEIEGSALHLILGIDQGTQSDFAGVTETPENDQIGEGIWKDCATLTAETQTELTFWYIEKLEKELKARDAEIYKLRKVISQFPCTQDNDNK